MVPTASAVAKMWMQTSGYKTRVYPRISPDSTRGFTLLEILLVLTIIGMASVLIIPNLSTLESRSFSTQVRELTALLNHGRRMAVVSGQPAATTLVTGIDQQAKELKPPRNSVGTWESQNTTVEFIDSTGTETLVETLLAVTFFPEGGSTGGIIRLSQDEQEINISVDPFSGRVAILEDAP